MDDQEKQRTQAGKSVKEKSVVAFSSSITCISDQGRPEVLAHPDSGASQAFFGIARKLATNLAKQASASGTGAPRSLRIIQ